MPRLLPAASCSPARYTRLLPACGGAAPVAQDRRKSLLYMERQMQRRLINEFRAQARELAPVLRSRGTM